MSPKQIGIIVLMMSLAVGCSGNRVSREGIMSQDLPLTVDDLNEIREGEKHYEQVLAEYSLYESPKIQTYLNAITESIAKVSDRPHLPYHVIMLEDEDVNMFGGPGGYIYVTRGFLNYAQSESEIAGAIAHEIAHIAGYEYSSIPHSDKIKTAYALLLKGTELAKDSIGTYGTGAYYGVKGLGKVAPRVAKRFEKDQEVVADSRAVHYLVDAGYDPRGYADFVDRLSKIPVSEVPRYVLYMNLHPPFRDRRIVLEREIDQIDFTSGDIEFRKDMLNEVRQLTINTPQDNIIFKPLVDPHPNSSLEFNEVSPDKNRKFLPQRKRYSWF